jgi:hypothetical protein
MRIEYQGHVEVTPSYSHVGYISAQAMPSVFERNSTFAGAYLGLALLSVVAARRVARARKGILPMLGFLVCLAAAFGGTTGFVLSMKHYDLTPEFVLTIQRMERLSEATERFASQHRRLPSQMEWSRLAAPEDYRDAWGEPFVYKMERHYADKAGQAYQIEIAEAMRRQTGRLSNAGFGLDGLFGTEDDIVYGAVDATGPLRYRKVDLTTFPHARAPRVASVTAM